jgi:hypothetical protein
MYTAPGLGQYISGCIMFEDFLYSNTAAGEQDNDGFDGSCTKFETAAGCLQDS